MLKNAEADTPERKYRVDPPRDGVGACTNMVHVVNAVNGKPRGGAKLGGPKATGAGGRAVVFWRFV
jgi:hypothetical protein